MPFEGDPENDAVVLEVVFTQAADFAEAVSPVELREAPRAQTQPGSDADTREGVRREVDAARVSFVVPGSSYVHEGNQLDLDRGLDGFEYGHAEFQ